MRKALSLIFLFIFITQVFPEETFKVIVLGSHGGPRENNVSGYLIAPKNSNTFIALDAGSLLNGIYLANQQKSFHDIQIDPASKWDFEAEILRNHITDYFISHAHLDHVAGMIINSTIDTNKNIFGIDSTINFLRDYLFNWKIWPNFGSEGEKPLKQYHYQRLKLEEQISIPNTEISMKPFLLNHSENYHSTAFLVGFRDNYIIYFGDTSPDELEYKKHIEHIWGQVAPLIKQNKLKGLFLECSYNNKRDSSKLFGHLDPQYLMEALYQLALLVNPIQPQLALNNLKVVVTHIKETLLNGLSSDLMIRAELEKLNTLGIQFIFPEQGERLEFP